jgi:hypothetical protein
MDKTLKQIELIQELLKIEQKLRDSWDVKEQLELIKQTKKIIKQLNNGKNKKN